MTALKRIFAATIAALLALMPMASAWAEGQMVYVGHDGAVVYDSKGDAVSTLDANTALELTDVKGDVCRIRYKGKTGYMKKADLARQTSAEAETETKSVSRTAYVARDGAAVYSAKGKAVGSLGLNAEVTVTAVKDDICRISYKGKTGYMKKADLSLNPVKAAEPEPEPAQSLNKTAYVSTDGAKVYNSKGKVVGALSLNAQVTVVAVNGKICKISAGGKTGYMNIADLSAKRTAGTGDASEGEAAAQSSAKPARGTAKEMDWWTSDIQKIFAKGVTATITDVETGLAWKEQRRGGTNHADVQPLTAEDTAAMKQAYGGTWSWTRRAIFVTIDGVNYAASMNGMPHGSGAITGNNFNGHHCIHFTNSRTHGSNRVCELHQAAIRRALEAVL